MFHVVVHGEFQIRKHFPSVSRCWQDSPVRDLAVLFRHLLTTVARLVGPGGARALVGESVLVRGEFQILGVLRPVSRSCRIRRRAISPFCFFIRWRRLPDTPVPAAPAPWWPNPRSSSTSC
jgi:hypothetical protein